MTDQETATERAAFTAAQKHLDTTETPDSWGRPMFKHSHIEAMWQGWKQRAVLYSTAGALNAIA